MNSLGSVLLRPCWIFTSCKLGQTDDSDPNFTYLPDEARRIYMNIEFPFASFHCQEEFKEMLEDAGFYCVRYHNLTAGVVALHSGFKL